MFTSYYVETLDGELLNYFLRLKDAKAYGERLLSEFKIVKLVGQYRYEGRHARVLVFNNGKYTG